MLFSFLGCNSTKTFTKKKKEINITTDTRHSEMHIKVHLLIKQGRIRNIHLYL